MTTPEMTSIMASSVALIVAILSGIFSYIISKKGYKWKGKAEAEIELVKSQLNRTDTGIDSLINLFGSNHHQAQNRRIEAIEKLWTKLLEFKKIVPSIGYIVYNILTEEEVLGYVDHVRKTQSIDRNTFIRSEEDSNFSTCISVAGEIELERPFLTEKIWFYFELYNIYLSRISYLLIEDAKKHSFKHWHKDNLIRNLLEKSLAPDECKYLYSQKFNTLKITMAFLENKILVETSKVLSGEQFSESAVGAFKKFEQLIDVKSKM